MNLRPPRFALHLLLALTVGLTAVQAQPDRTFTTSPVLSLEIRTLIRLLEEAHYNRESVKPESYEEVIPNYMTALDGQRLFFLEADKEAFIRQHAGGLYWNIASLGNIDPAYDIFRLYEERTQARVQWIFNELEQEFDLARDETYATDRSKVSWPANPEEANTLWKKRLKFELLQEVLNDKTTEEAIENVRKRYERMLKNLADIDGPDLRELFLANVAKLYDPHSTYFSADTFEDFGIQMRLQLVGIGALLGVEEDYCVVKEVIAGGPADVDSRLKPNDKIIAVAQGKNEEPIDVIGMKLRKIVDLIRGKKGTQVRLTVQPAAAPDPSVRREIVLTRDLVNLDSARAHAAIFEVPDHQGNPAPIGVITLPAFYGPDSASDAAKQNSATQDVARLLRQLNDAGIEGLVLDLRNNGGGLLSEAIDLTGLFIETGPVVQVRSYYGDVKVDSDEDTDVAYAGPMAVLVSKFSASASEIVAGALQNYGRAVVVGDSSTHGKGTVQTVVEMQNLLARAAARTTEKTGATKLTIQKFYLPNGASTQRRGVVPDIVLPSIEDLLPAGEKDLPHALVWDEIPSSLFEGRPLDQRILGSLREASLARQANLEEFSYLQESIDWFKQRQDEKVVSLNLTEREQQKEADKQFRERMKQERERLQQQNFAFREFLLAPRPERNQRAEPEEGEEDDAGLLDDEDGPEGYARLDIHLREAMRVLMDAVELGRDPEQWVAGQAPLTAQFMTKS